eukprot:9931924-Lingulodinium_polyedra.AAC.1
MPSQSDSTLQTTCPTVTGAKGESSARRAAGHSRSACRSKSPNWARQLAEPRRSWRAFLPRGHCRESGKQTGLVRAE